MGSCGFRSYVWVACSFVILGLVLLTAKSVCTFDANQVDVSGSVTVLKSGLVYNRVTNTFDATLTITNKSSANLRSPLSIVLSAISPSSVTLTNAGGVTPEGYSYIDLPAQSTLLPGESSKSVLKFRNPNRVTFTYQVKVFAASNKPLANAGADQTAYLLDTVYLSGVNSTDPGGLPLTYAWTFDSLPEGSGATLSDPTSVNPSFVVDKHGTYVISLVVSNGGLLGDPDQVTVSTSNSPPVAKAGPDHTVYVTETVTLDGSASSDVDGDTLSYEWSIRSQPPESRTELSDPAAVKPTLYIDEPGSYIIELIVSDGALESGPSMVTLTTENSRPAANAGRDQTAHVTDVVTLDGSASSDPDGDPLSYRWSLATVPAGSGAALLNPTRVNPDFTVDLPGTYVAQLAVSDGKLESLPDTVTVTTENSLPTANAGAPQEAFVNAKVTLDGSKSKDPDGDTLSYSWSLVAKPLLSASALYDPDTREPWFFPDLAGDYVGQLIVSDGTLKSDPSTVGITVNFRMTTVPDVVGATRDAAQAAIIGAGLTLGSMGEEYSAQVTSGCVIRQTPTGGSPAIVGSAVDLVVSLGPRMIAVPAVTGLSEDGARQAITDSGLVVGSVSREHSSTIPAGEVMYQNPPAGAVVAPGSPVDLVISLGTTLTLVPDMIGLSQSAALQAILSANLTVGAISSAHSETVSSGYVLSQSIAAGTPASLGSPVGLVISSGPEHGGLPPAPSVVAPPPELGVSSSLFSLTEFLYKGAVPLQTGVSPGTIELRRAAVIRGKVMARDGSALPGVKISILNHSEFGQTLSRADGMFDLAVNGGGPLTVNYELEGYLGVQRQVEVPWQDYVFVPDARMIQADPNVTSIDLTLPDEFQIVSGSVHKDERGTRRERLLIPRGTQAFLVMPDKTEQPISRFTVRVTEYTVGPDGEQVMPAVLPPTSAYTYCEEFSVDEAIAAGAPSVRLSVPAISYLENFLSFPVGTTIPMGAYERGRGAWIPADSGKVVKILAVVDGVATIDSNGDGLSDDGIALGMTSAERQAIASLYPAGQTLWRVPVPHFTYPWDKNMATSCEGGCEKAGTGDPRNNDPNCANEEPNSSVITCQSQVLSERLEVTGTPFSLHYKSDRARGRTENRSLEIPLTKDTLPDKLQKVYLEVFVAGQKFAQSFAPQANLTVIFVWDGKDAFDRPVFQGRWPVRVRIGYGYPLVYSSTDRFGYNGNGIRITVTDDFFTLWKEWRGSLGTLDAREQGLGGWTLNVHHLYDAAGRTLYQGDAERLDAESMDVITTVAGSGGSGCGTPGMPAPKTGVAAIGVAAGPDGSIYIPGGANCRYIRRVGPDGILTNFAGNGGDSFGGDGGPATSAALYRPQAVAVGPDGSIYEAEGSRIRRVSPDGIINTVAGTGAAGFSGDGGPATSAKLNGPTSIAVGPDGSLYIADYYNCRIRRVDPAGIISTLAGAGLYSGGHGDGIPATQAHLNEAQGVAVGPDGSVYIADWTRSYTPQRHRVRRVGPDGIITTVAGTGAYGYSGDGGPATNATLSQPVKVAAGPDGSIYIVEAAGNRIRRVGPDGIITTITGTGDKAYAGDGGPAANGKLNTPNGVAVGPDGGLYIADGGNGRIRRVSQALPGVAVGDFTVPSRDGSELFLFNSSGRHLRTLDAITGAVRYEFLYDAGGRLMAVTDLDGEVTIIERDHRGNPTAIVGPYGQKTMLGLDAEGYLSRVSNPAGETVHLGYAGEGLLASLTDPRGAVKSFTYDGTGRLVKDADAAGGWKALARTRTANGYEVDLFTAMGRGTTFKVENLTTGDERHVNTYPDGTGDTLFIGVNGSLKLNSADGTIVEALLGPDPRFGMQVPLAKTRSVTTPSGLESTVSNTRTVVLSDPENPLSVTSLTETFTVNGRNYTRAYNAASRKYTITTPQGRLRTVTIDAKGRVVEGKYANLEPVSYTYDSRGRVATMTIGSGVAGRTTSFSYNNDGYLTTVTDPLGRVTSYDYYTAGRVRSESFPDGGTVLFGYDANGNMISLTPPEKPAHTVAYNALDFLSAYTPPDLGAGSATTRYFYNLDRQRTQKARPDGLVIDFEYDSGGHLSTVIEPGGERHYTYHATAGNLAGISAPGGNTLSYTYDGSLLQSETCSGDVSGSVGYGYDNNFRITSISINAGNAVGYVYDTDSLITNAGDLVLTRNVQNGLLAGTALGAVTDALTYNSFGEHTSYNASYSGSEVFKQEFTYDSLGRITQKIETISGTSDTYDYTYDPAGRLKTVVKNNTTVSAYAYDGNGNRLSYTGADGTMTGTYDDQDRLISYGSATYAFTANGELQSKTVGSQVTLLGYDVFGNLKSVTLPNGTLIEYAVDGRDRRIGKKTNGTWVQKFLYMSQLKPVAELDASDTVVSRFVYGSRRNVPDYLVKGGVTYRIISDHVGSPRLVINTADGTVAQRMEYDEFGNVIADTNPGLQPFGFAGGLYDPDTKLVRFGKRDYDSESGRWTAQDPILFRGSKFNLYAYVENNPVNLIDPDGSIGVDTCLKWLLKRLAKKIAKKAFPPTIAHETPVWHKGFELLGGDGLDTTEDPPGDYYKPTEIVPDEQPAIMPSLPDEHPEYPYPGLDDPPGGFGPS